LLRLDGILRSERRCAGHYHAVTKKQMGRKTENDAEVGEFDMWGETSLSDECKG
jgi:hypothetical protein